MVLIFLPIIKNLPLNFPKESGGEHLAEASWGEGRGVATKLDLES